MKNNILKNLISQDISVTLENVLDNSRAVSGGDRDMNFLKFLIDNRLLLHSEAVLERTDVDFKQEYYSDKYKKASMESDRHFYCRVIIQEELKKKGMASFAGFDVGNMDILRSNSNYDIVLDDFSAIIDIGLTPARNFFRGLTDLKVQYYLITTYFDDYMDNIVFSVFSRGNNEDFLTAIRDFQEGFKEYVRNPPEQFERRLFYTDLLDIT